VLHVARERNRVADAQRDRMIGHIQDEGALLDLHQLPGPGYVRLAYVQVPGAQGPVPQLQYGRWLGAGHEHPTPTELAGPQGGTLSAGSYPDGLGLGRFNQSRQPDTTQGRECWRP